MHDNAGYLVYNRFRNFHSGLGRFYQRYPIGYLIGLNLYSALHVMQWELDPTGLYTYDYHDKPFAFTAAQKNIFENSMARIRGRLDGLVAQADDLYNTCVCEKDREEAKKFSDGLKQIKHGMDSTKQLEITQKAMMTASGAPDKSTNALAEWNKGWFDADDIFLNTNAGWDSRPDIDLDITLFHELTHIVLNTVDGHGIPHKDAYFWQDMMDQRLVDLFNRRGKCKEQSPGIRGRNGNVWMPFRDIHKK